ncbi:MAG TPA: type III secretion inner membrane ring lipoprotein SctJ, partial [Candidatus Methylacidiphilales bacterium]|nr:type III secretion inner membrane ring lipoprotein SctJ [Candidatus Methylacidiphilales bacterium]
HNLLSTCKLAHANCLRGFAMLAVAVVLTGCGTKDLYTNLSESEANEMIAILSRNTIDAQKAAGTEGTFTVTVPTEKFSDSVDILKKQGFPRDKFTGIGQVFTKTGLVSSPTEERIRFMFALSQGIAETLTHIDGVVTARVHLVLPDNNPLADKVTPSSAAVFIKYRRTSQVESQIPQIKNLVINSIEGLTYEKVSVALFPADP